MKCARNSDSKTHLKKLNPSSRTEIRRKSLKYLFQRHPVLWYTIQLGNLTTSIVAHVASLRWTHSTSHQFNSVHIRVHVTVDLGPGGQDFWQHGTSKYHAPPTKNILLFRMISQESLQLAEQGQVWFSNFSPGAAPLRSCFSAICAAFRCCKKICDILGHWASWSHKDTPKS